MSLCKALCFPSARIDFVISYVLWAFYGSLRACGGLLEGFLILGWGPRLRRVVVGPHERRLTPRWVFVGPPFGALPDSPMRAQ